LQYTGEKMRLFYALLIGFFIGGCASVQKGDHVTYVSDEYIFVENNFINKSIDCVELGKLEQGMMLKFCVGENYASVPVQGFIFEHHYSGFDERFIGPSLSFKTKSLISVQCSSETKDDASFGKEYVNCMVPQNSFDLYAFIVNAEGDVPGQLRAALGEQKIYPLVIDEKSRMLLKQFYKDRAKKSRSDWKKRAL